MEAAIDILHQRKKKFAVRLPVRLEIHMDQCWGGVFDLKRQTCYKITSKDSLAEKTLVLSAQGELNTGELWSCAIAHRLD